jgi:cohesin loading factor subunit SCC2
MEDIFEAEDMVPIEGPSGPEDQTQTQHSDSPFRFFSSLTDDWGHPRLHPHVMRKLLKALEQIAKRRRSKKASQLASVDAHLLGRLLRLLQRSVKAGEDLRVFVGPTVPKGDVASAGGGKVKGTPAKKGKKAKGKEQNQDQNQERERSRSKTPMVIDEEESESVAPVDWDKLGFILRIAMESVLAADGCIALLGSDNLSKQVS